MLSFLVVVVSSAQESDHNRINMAKRGGGNTNKTFK